VSPVGTLADQTQPFSIQLARGWNMIGSVYLQPTLLGAAQVRVAGQLMTLAEAAKKGLVRDYAWRYDPVDRAYKLVSAGENLQPFVGYWIRALVDADLILNPPGSRSAGGTQITRSAAMSEDNWTVQLVARAGNSVDSANVIGVASDSLQIEKPAPLENYVHVQLRSPENDAPLAVDVRRSAGAKQVYTFEVVTDMPNTPVTLSWPDVAKISRKFEMVLVDVDANVRRVLTSLPSYTYNSGANGGTRRFQIIVQPRVRTAAVISNVRVAQTRSAGSNRVQITYTLSTEASVAVQITDASGKPIRALQAGQAIGRGVNSVTWDGRNGAGIAVPAGAYVVKITATTEDGQTASVVQPVVLTR
ncbi:MAG: FlgD immunoglobulin-like domain containing protein, partial [Armatimonadota bacterium]